MGDSESLRMIKAGRPKFCPKLFGRLSREAQSLVRSLLRKNPAKRPNVTSALRHPWLRQVADSAPEVDPIVLQRIKDSLGAPPLCRAFQWMAAFCMPVKEETHMHQQFKAFGAGDAGVISCDDFQLALAKSGISRSDSKALFDLLDSNGHGQVAYCDFLAAASTSHLDLDEDTLRIVFGTFDADGCGSLTAACLRISLGAMLRDCSTEDMIAGADLSGDGRLSFEELNSYFGVTRKGSSSTDGSVDSYTCGNFSARRYAAEWIAMAWAL